MVEDMQKTFSLNHQLILRRNILDDSSVEMLFSQIGYQKIQMIGGLVSFRNSMNRFLSVDFGLTIMSLQYYAKIVKLKMMIL